jgi:hypothetical protein
METKMDFMVLLNHKVQFGNGLTTPQLFLWYRETNSDVAFQYTETKMDIIVWSNHKVQFGNGLTTP